MFWWHEAFFIEGKKKIKTMFIIFSVGEVFWFHIPVLR